MTNYTIQEIKSVVCGMTGVNEDNYDSKLLESIITHIGTMDKIVENCYRVDLYDAKVIMEAKSHFGQLAEVFIGGIKASEVSDCFNVIVNG